MFTLLFYVLCSHCYASARCFRGTMLYMSWYYETAFLCIATLELTKKRDKTQTFKHKWPTIRAIDTAVSATRDITLQKWKNCHLKRRIKHHHNWQHRDLQAAAVTNKKSTDSATLWHPHYNILIPLTTPSITDEYECGQKFVCTCWNHTWQSSYS